MRLPSSAPALGLLAGALLIAAFGQGGQAWPLGFVALLPWLWVLDRTRTVGGTVAMALAMTMALALAGFWWFGLAIGRFTGLGATPGVALLVLLAPLLQPQVLAWALLRRAVRGRFGEALGALAGAVGWLGSEWLVLKPLGDTLGHALYPALWLRQAADLGGTAGLTLLLLLSNEALHVALLRWRAGARGWGPALAVAVLPPLLLAGYGHWQLNRPVDAQAPQLRMGLIQANLTELEARRRAQGSYEVVRELLDTHFAMTYDAVERQRADAVLWSETIYPTTFGQPKSEAGAGFDQEIRTIVEAARVPFVFGTYERDATGEYNAAAVVEPGRGLVGFYRKTRLFPFTEWVPGWLDGSLLRSVMPWAGRWQSGSGARLLPLRLRDGRELPVQPLICRDSLDPTIAHQAARLGAVALLTLSNDSWFSDAPLGAQWHQAAAAFRSIETRLPQFRVTTNGYSAVIDQHGSVRAGSLMNERSLVMGELPVPTPPRTLAVWWGDWVAPALAAALLLALAWHPVLRQVTRRLERAHAQTQEPALTWPLPVTVLSHPMRFATALLRAVAGFGLLIIGLGWSHDEVFRGKAVEQLWVLMILIVAPEVAAWCLLRACRAHAAIESGALVLQRGARRQVLPLQDVQAVRLWSLRLPGAGLSLRLGRGDAGPGDLALRRPGALAHALAAAGGPAAPAMSAFEAARERQPGGLLDHPLVKLGLLPLLLAVPAFLLHQNIAYGSAWGEWLSFGARAYFIAFGLWWGAWTLGVMLLAAALRLLIETVAACGAWWRPAHAALLRRALEALAKLLLYAGLPMWLLLRISGLI